MRLNRPALSLLLALLGGCAGVQGPELPEWLQGAGGGSGRELLIPNQVAGGSRSGAPLPGSTDARLAAQGLTPEQRAERVAQAAALWTRASGLGQTEAAGDLYRDLADDYPESPNAAEAMFRYGAVRYRQGEWTAAIEGLVNYMTSIPVNPHLAEVEEMLYTSAIRLLAPRSGLAKFFSHNDTALNTLDFVAQTFPAGTYADDALLRLARHHQAEEEWALAVLHYKEILIRYPNSEWSFRARLGLADSYLQRDQGDRYHAGFVDLDPRETYPNEQAETFGAEVKSSLRLALEHYETFLERIAVDPGRQAEYAQEVAYARRMRADVRSALADKDLRVANWYASKGDQQGTRTYLQYASAYSETESGRRALAQLRTLGGGKIPSGGSAPAAPRAQPVQPTPARGPVGVPTQVRPQPGVPQRPLAPITSGPPSRQGVPPPPPPPNWPGVAR